MNISEIAIKRPVFTVMVTVALMVLGAMGLSRLGTDLFPDVSFPVVVVNVPYPGASPREVEQLVSKPIEDAVVSLNGIDRLKTTSREGLSTTVIIFKLGVDLQDGATQVRERVAQTRVKLPQRGEGAVGRALRRRRRRPSSRTRSAAPVARSPRSVSSRATSSSRRSSRSTASPPSR